MTINEHEEISASVAAHAELGPRYDSAVAEGLVERIGEEIDRRVDARLRAGQPTPPAFAAPPAPPAFTMPPVPAAQAAPPVPHRRSNGVSGVILGLGSMGIAVGATAAIVSHHGNAVGQFFMVSLIWIVIAIVNIAHSQRN